MIDLHNHILPNADDGSTSLEMSLSMLRTAAEQGITDVVNTVHFQHPKFDLWSMKNEKLKIENYGEEIENVQSVLDKEGIPIRLHLGAEVFYLPNLMELRKNPLCTFGHGKYMLIEFMIHSFPREFEEMLFDLKMSGCTPIIAHPERYRPVQADVSMLEKWIHSGCVIQVDAGSLTGGLGKSAKAAAETIIKKGWCHLLGSDSHDDRKRNFCLKEAVEIARGLVGDHVESFVTTNPKNVLEGKYIDTEIPYNAEKRESSFFHRLKKVFGGSQ